jgi:hypothetical protein
MWVAHPAAALSRALNARWLQPKGRPSRLGNHVRGGRQAGRLGAVASRPAWFVGSGLDECECECGCAELSVLTRTVSRTFTNFSWRAQSPPRVTA